VFYKLGMPLDTASEREKAAVGFVNTTFRMRILVGAVLSQVKNDIEYAIYDGGDSNNLTPDRLFFSNLPANWKTSGRFVEKHTFSIGDHAWTILFYDNSTLTLRDRYAPWVLPAGLMFISCLMACLLYFLITSRKRAIKLAEQMTEEFRKSEQKYRTIFETLQDVYYETDIQGNIITISPSIESYTGIAQQDILGKKATDFYINPKEREQLLSILHTDGFVLDFETSLKGKEGNTLTVSVTSKMLRNNEGKPVGVAGMLRDITRRKHAEENVKRKNHELEKAQEELDRLVKKLQGDKRKLEEAMTKDEFLSMAAHELRTPLGTMRWRIEEMLGSGRKLSPATKEDLEKMYNNILRLLDIVNKLLDVSRINQEKIKENPQMIDVVHLATMVIDTLEERIHEQDIHMVFEKTKKAVAFFIDQNLLEEIFVNLLTNAIKYNNKGGNVTLIIEEKPAGLSIEVTDTGIGIPTKDQKTIFQKFKRASNVDPRKYEGNGLGLFVVKSYVEHWKGKITLVSREGKGTKVTIVIPKKTS
ncbi:MAG: ATP-binding protein, partial [Candidatus Levyibacteriota bacterium]